MKAVVFFLFLIFGYSGFAQLDCVLGVGGRDNEKIRNDIFKDKAAYLMKQHQESSPEVLMEVSKKYQSFIDSMAKKVRMIDKRLLTGFNETQYERYLKLCSQLSLRPIHINRSVDEN